MLEPAPCTVVMPRVESIMAGDRLLDVGSGGGQPGIPLAIARPGLNITVADSNSKKVAFLRQAVIELGLSRVAVQAGRIEAWQPEEPFSAIISRAFADTGDFVRLTRDLLAPGGVWLAMKGVYPREELSHLPAGVGVAAVQELQVPGVEGARHLVVLREE